MTMNKQEQFSGAVNDYGTKVEQWMDKVVLSRKRYEKMCKEFRYEEMRRFMNHIIIIDKPEPVLTDKETAKRMRNIWEKR